MYVKEIREIWRADTLWANPEVANERKGGTCLSHIPIILPKDVEKGTYKIRFTVQTDYTKDTRETTFTVN
jgi:hypothetical protein